jgi:hypothetical protein
MVGNVPVGMETKNRKYKEIVSQKCARGGAVEVGQCDETSALKPTSFSLPNSASTPSVLFQKEQGKRKVHY